MAAITSAYGFIFIDSSRRLNVNMGGQVVKSAAFLPQVGLMSDYEVVCDIHQASSTGRAQNSVGSWTTINNLSGGGKMELVRYTLIRDTDNGPGVSEGSCIIEVAVRRKVDPSDNSYGTLRLNLKLTATASLR